MTFEVYRAQWFAETGLVDFGGRGFWDHTTTSHAFDSEAEAKACLLTLGGIEEDPKHPGEFLNSFPMGLARVRKQLTFDRAETEKLK